MSDSIKDLTWESTKLELNVCRLPDGRVDYDKFRRSKLEAVEAHTKIPLVVYVSDFLNTPKVKACDGQVSIDLADLQGFQEVLKGLPDGPLDVLLHSPGGSAEAAESIVQIIRQRFNPVRFIIPVVAKSAATMISLSGNTILMPPSAELGPIDPQFRLSDGAGGSVMTPGQVLVDQFEEAQRQICANPSIAPSWAPVLARYGVGLYFQAKNAIQLSKNLVHGWLKQYMFSGRSDAQTLADGVVGWLGNHNAFQSHGRRVSLPDLQSKSVEAKDIRMVDPKLWHLVQEAWYAIQHTLEDTGVFKLFENSYHRCLVQSIQVVIGVGPVQPKK